MKIKLLFPILLILSFIFVGSYYELPDVSNGNSMRMDTIFVDKTDTIFITDIIRDTTLQERVDTLIVVITEQVRDTAFVRDIVYVDSLVGTYDRNETNLNHNITRTYNWVGAGQHEVTYSWNSDATFNDINWTCLEYTEADPPTTPEPISRVLLRNSTTLPYTETEEYSVTIGQECNARLYVYIWSQDLKWSIRWDDYLDLGELDSINLSQQTN